MSYEAAPGMPEDASARQVTTAPQPPSVSLAEKLMYAGAAVTVVSGLIGLFADRDGLRDQVREQLAAAGQAADEASVDAAMQLGLVSGIVVMVISAGLWALLGWLNGRGVGWARILATVLGVLGVLVTVGGLAGAALLPGAAPGGGLSMVLSLVLGLIALAVVILLWRPDAKAFFADRRRR